MFEGVTEVICSSSLEDDMEARSSAYSYNGKWIEGCPTVAT